MKRTLSLLLAAALAAALILPAAAETAASGAPAARGAPAAGEAAADARLARVTQAVKAVLNLDTSGYETFRGSESGDLDALWDLTWEGERRSLSVQALEDGTVASFSKWDYNLSSDTYGGAQFPAFPENAHPDDRAVVQAFLDRVLRKGEAAKADRSETDLSLDGSDDSWWYQKITLNGLPSPLTASVCVENGQVTSFGRDLPETSYIGGVPSPDAQADRDKAAVNLKNTLALRLEYVLEHPGDTRAVLRYTPEGTHEFLVDAKTGELLDLTELEEKMSKGYDAAAGDNGEAPAAMAEASAGRAEDGLTAAERAGVAELEGALSKEELDKALRAESAYGLTGYALISASYETDGEGGVTCALRYARTDGGERLTRNITVDAKTGAVESIWSSAPFDREKTVAEEDALKKAEAFCKAWCPDKDLVLYQTDYELTPWRMEELPYWGFTFAQEVNGLPFQRNAVYVNIDTADGSIYGLSSSWDDAVTFDNANGTVSMETALAAWTGTYDAVLAYRKAPQRLVKADPVQAKKIEQGMEYGYGLRLTYGLERSENYEGVDAKTGALIPEDRSSTREALAYTDLAGCGEKADIEKLARYGAGYASETFRPGKSLTQWDLVCLACSLSGPALDPDSRSMEDRETEYHLAYRLGLLTPAERDDKAVLTRGEVVRMLLNAAGYGPAARLEGIYASDLRDFENQPAGERGYAAIAQALGMVSGAYAGSRSATRGEAASMLCRVLERKL